MIHINQSLVKTKSLSMVKKNKQKNFFYMKVQTGNQDFEAENKLTFDQYLQI